MRRIDRRFAANACAADCDGGRVPLEKAYIESAQGFGRRTAITVLFNPAEYSIERANAYKSTAVPGLGSPLIQFVNGDAATLSMDLFLDDLTDPDGPHPRSRSRPGAARGRASRTASPRSSRCSISTASCTRRRRSASSGGRCASMRCWRRSGARSRMFRPDGTPARATLSVSFREYPARAARRRRSALESADKTKRRQISASESIWLIADQEYGDVRELAIDRRAPATSTIRARCVPAIGCAFRRWRRTMC